jgi:D-threo-aldose 1-dehydrogenase
MLTSLTLPNGRATSSLGFGCASLLRIPEAEQRQRLLDLAVDHGILHFDVARMYGLGFAEAELAGVIRRHPGQLTIATKFGLGKSGPPSSAVQRQGGMRRILQAVPVLRPLARRLVAGRIRRDFSADHCRLSLATSLKQLGIDALDLLLLHEPLTHDWVDPSLEDTLNDLLHEAQIGGYGISGHPSPTFSLWRQRQGLAPHLLQWEDNAFEFSPLEVSSPRSGLPLRSRYGLIRNSLPRIQQAFAFDPQLQRHWSERLSVDLIDSDVLVAALLSSSLASFPNDLLVFSTTSPARLLRLLSFLHAPPWDPEDVTAFRQFWLPTVPNPAVP